MKGEKNDGQRICDRLYLERIMDERCRLIDAQFDLVRQRFDAQAEALIHAEKVMEARLHALNQLREQVDHNTQVYLRQDVYNAKTLRYDEWIEGVNKDITIMKTRSVVYTSVLGVVFLVIDLVMHFAGK